ncbi:hypothetical protein CEQ90_11295 [Lewinellaceae bacterium SD302]|nr:hypothetical protein CEQ90_11295 [Lewinellaceae bacterium SD302]
MKQSLHPISRDLRALLHGYYERLRAKINSPWTKLTVLALLMILATRQELSFSVSINAADLLGTSLPVAGQSVSAANVSPVLNVSQLVSNPAPAVPKKVWTAKQKRQLAYVADFRALAQEEMRKNGVPASITLAQGLLESNIGKSRLARENNNHFGIKCFSRSCRKGHCTNFSDDSHKDFFMKFGSTEESYHAHSKLLKKDRYKKLFELRITDYKNWARGLSKAGYATDPKYADKLIALIEALELHVYDALP